MCETKQNKISKRKNGIKGSGLQGIEGDSCPMKQGDGMGQGRVSLAFMKGEGRSHALIWEEKDPGSEPGYSRGWSCWLKEQQGDQWGQSRAGKGRVGDGV